MSFLFLNKLLILQPCNILTQLFYSVLPPLSPPSLDGGKMLSLTPCPQILHGAWDRADGGILLNE